MAGIIENLKINYNNIFLMFITSIVFYIMVFNVDMPRSRKIIFSFLFCCILYFFLVISNVVSPENQEDQN